MTVPPSPSEEDCRRVSSERATLLRERIQHTNRIRGLLFGQGSPTIIRCTRTPGMSGRELRTGDGRSLPTHVKAEILREIDRLELVYARSARSKLNAMKCCGCRKRALRLHYSCSSRALARSSATVLYLEGLFRHFENRRQLAAYAGLAPSTMEEVVASTTSRVSRRQAIHVCARQWSSLPGCGVRYQPASALSCWFRQRVGSERGRTRRISIVALARKLLIALSRYVTHGEIPAGAVVKASLRHPGRRGSALSRVPRGLISPVGSGRAEPSQTVAVICRHTVWTRPPEPDDLENEGLWCQPFWERRPDVRFCGHQRPQSTMARATDSTTEGHVGR